MIPYEAFDSASNSLDSNSSDKSKSSDESKMEDWCTTVVKKSPTSRLGSVTAFLEEHGFKVLQELSTSTNYGTKIGKSKINNKDSNKKYQSSMVDLDESVQSTSNTKETIDIYTSETTTKAVDASLKSDFPEITDGKEENKKCDLEQNKKIRQIKGNNSNIEEDILTSTEILVDNTDHVVKKTLIIEDPDAMVVVNGQEFAVYKHLLIKKSTYFQEAFAGKDKKQIVIHVSCLIFSINI